MAVITSEGKYYKFGFDPINGGEFIKLDEKNLKWIYISMNSIFIFIDYSLI